MAGEGGVDIDLYATVDEFEPEVAGQVRFRDNVSRLSSFSRPRRNISVTVCSCLSSHAQSFTKLYT